MLDDSFIRRIRIIKMNKKDMLHNRFLANKNCCRCPCCGEDRYISSCTGDNSGIIQTKYIIAIDDNTKQCLMQNVYSCYRCGTRWKSEPFIWEYPFVGVNTAIYEVKNERSISNSFRKKHNKYIQKEGFQMNVYDNITRGLNEAINSEKNSKKHIGTATESATESDKQAYWKPQNKEPGKPEAICSNCGRGVVYQVIDNKYEYENFCPHCGFAMNQKTDTVPEKQDNKAELIRLIAEHPKLPVVAMVDSDIVSDDSYARWMGTIGTAVIGEYTLYDDRIFDERDEFIERYYDNNCDELCEKFEFDPRIKYMGNRMMCSQEQLNRNKENEQRLDKYLNEIADKVFRKAIIVNIDLPDDVFCTEVKE